MEIDKTIKLKAFEFLCDNKVGVLTTISAYNLPESAVIYYIVQGKDIYIISRENTAKIQNILRNNKVSLVMFKEIPPVELQIQGTAGVINEAGQKASISSLYLETASKNGGVENWPPVMKLLNAGSFEFIKISIDRFKFSDFSGQDAVIAEGTVADWM